MFREFLICVCVTLGLSVLLLIALPKFDPTAMYDFELIAAAGRL